MSAGLLRLASFALLAVSIGPVNGAPPSDSEKGDPCSKVAGKTYVIPSDALACYKSFAFNETIRTNVLDNADRVLDFFTFESYYKNSPAPFQESTVNIRGKLAGFRKAKFATDYDFHKAFYDFGVSLNDGHTSYYPNCYLAYQSLLPTPVVSLETKGVQAIHVVPDAVELVALLGPDYASLLNTLSPGFNLTRLAGARITSIEGQAPYDYVDKIASTEVGAFLDHGIRVNGALSYYRISGGQYSQRWGTLAGPSSVFRDSLRVTLIPVGETKPLAVNIPYIASYAGSNFTDGPSYWAGNCAANDATNGIDYRPTLSSARRTTRPRPKGDMIDLSQTNAVGLPDKYIPTLPAVSGSGDVLRFHILPGNKTGVIFVGSFSPVNPNDFQTSIVQGITAFKAAGVTRLIIDVTGNGGGYVCLGQFLHAYLAGSSFGYPGFESTQRANPLAKKIVAAHAAAGDDDIWMFYSPYNWAFLNDTIMPSGYDYDSPPLPFINNGISEPTSQRFHDTCGSDLIVPLPESPPFDLKNVAIVTNGYCASTCAMFTTLMTEQHNTKIAVFGGKPGLKMEYKGMAGNQVLDWPDLDSEIKTVGLKDDPLSPPDVLVDVNFRVNWRSAWSWKDKKVPIAYRSERPFYQIPYTKDTYNNPQNLWIFSEKKFFG